MLREPFQLRGVVHLVRPAGARAHHLEDLRTVIIPEPHLSGVHAISERSLFYHCFHPQLRHPAAEEAPPDDFSAWVNGVVQDRETAERLSFAIQHRGTSSADLRQAMVQVLDALPEKVRIQRDAPEDGDFVFLEMDSVVVETGLAPADPSDLMVHLESVHPNVLFYHLIEQPWLAPAEPSLVDWVRAQGDDRLADWLAEALVGRPIEDARRRLFKRWRRSRLGRRLADAAVGTETERREAGRRAVARLVRRITGSEDDDARSRS